MIEKAHKASVLLFERNIKTFKFQDVTIHKKARSLNLVQKLSFYPNCGVGFQVRRFTWPETMYRVIADAKFKSNRNGKFKGIQFRDGKVQWEYPRKFNGANKRGVWDYNLGQFEQFETDNGMVFTRADYEAYFEIRKRKTQSQNKPPVEEDAEQDD